MRKRSSVVPVVVFLLVIVSPALTLPIRNCGLRPFGEGKCGAMLDQPGSIQAHSGSEPPLTEWNRTYGSLLDEGGSFVMQTSNGGYAIAGWRKETLTPMGPYNAWLVKIDATGGAEWSTEYGGTGTDSAFSMVETSDGGYALAGGTNSFGDVNGDFWLIKTDSAGNLQWNKTYGGAGREWAYSMVQTDDGGYALAGETNSFGAGYPGDFWLIKTDAGGMLQWSQAYGGDGMEIAYSIVQTSDGGYALAGRFNSSVAQLHDFWLIKTNATGDMEWSKTYGGAYYDWARSVVQTIDGGYAVAGITNSFGEGYNDFWLVKTDSAGNLQWSKTFGGPHQDEAYCVVQASDGGYAVAGITNSFGEGYNDFWLVKTDSAGNLEWNKTYGGTMKDDAYSVIHTTDGGYALAGFTYSFGAGSGDVWLIKTDPDPNLIDSDGDGLLDNWEMNGIDYNSDGAIDLTLPGADPEYKNLYIEIDYMGTDGTHDHNPDADGINNVIRAFRDAPVDNPNGTNGIALHIEVDEQIPHQNVINVWDDFNTIKSDRFGSQTQRSDPNRDNILAAKKMAYRYALFVHQYAYWDGTQWVTTTSSGIAELPGNDFIVSLGAFTNNRGSRDEQEGTLMHELGHTLNLRHGGGDDIHGKPNYLSVMSYSRQFSDLIRGRRLDYSRAKLATLYESNLNENLGIQGPPGDQTVYGPLVWNATTGSWQAFVDPSQGPIDWNRDGVATDIGVSRSINDFTAIGFGDTGLDELEGHDDWGNVLYNFRFAGEFSDGVHLKVADQEITWEIAEQMKNTTIVGFHDIAVTNVVSSKTIVGGGYPVSINITVVNTGYYNETFNVNAYHGNAIITSGQWETFWGMGDVNRDGYINDTDGDIIEAAWGSSPGDLNWCPWADLNQDLIVNQHDRGIFRNNKGLDIWSYFISGAIIETKTVNNLSPGNSAILVFTWNTTGVAKGNYTISAYAVPILCEEADRADNNYGDGVVKVTIPGDIDGDGDVDPNDFYIFVEAYGSQQGDSNYNPEANINCDGKVDSADFYIFSRNYGKTA